MWNELRARARRRRVLPDRPVVAGRARQHVGDARADLRRTGRPRPAASCRPSSTRWITGRDARPTPGVPQCDDPPLRARPDRPGPRRRLLDLVGHRARRATAISEAYAAELAAAAEKSGVDESVLTGEARLHGRRIGVLVGEFGFLAGSIGRAAADRIVAGDRARHPRGAAAGRGARSAAAPGCRRARPAFVQMVRISAAVAAHRTAGPALPRLPAQPHHRRRDGVVGLARPRHRRRAGRPRRLPRPAGLRGALRQAVPRATCRPRRTSTPTASSTPSCRPTRSPTSSTAR